MPAAPATVALIGYGSLAKLVVDEVQKTAGLTIVGIVVRETRRADVERLLLPHGICAVTRIADLARKPQLVVELAGQEAVATHVLDALQLGVDVAIASVGALASDKLLETLLRDAHANGAQVRLLSGAVGGIDALAAHRAAGLTRVAYSGRKPPAAWRGTRAEPFINLGSIIEPTVVFQGSAREASRLYPRNANVAATTALAGLGFDRTQVELIADPTITRNIHRIEAWSAAGHFAVELAGQAAAGNAKTSALTGFSVLRELRNLVEPLRL